MNRWAMVSTLVFIWLARPVLAEPMVLVQDYLPESGGIQLVQETEASSETRTIFTDVPGATEDGLVRNRFAASVGILLLHPTWDHNPAFVTLVGPNFTIHDFNWDAETGPRVWAGYVTDQGLGIGVRYWKFDNTANQVNLVNPGGGVRIETGFFHNIPGFVPPLNIDSQEAGDNLSISNGIDLDVWDLEVSQAFTFRDWMFQVLGGLRYANLRQSYEAGLLNEAAVVNGVPTRRQLNQRLAVDFEGFGPTLALELRRPLLGGLALFGNARGAILYGYNDQTAVLLDTQTNLATGAVTVANPSARYRFHDTLPVTELEIGAEWSRTFRSARILFQGALVSQTWHNAGAPGVQQGEADLGFFGFSLTTGLYY